jgi:hypothetical protein
MPFFICHHSRSRHQYLFWFRKSKWRTNLSSSIQNNILPISLGRIQWFFNYRNSWTKSTVSFWINLASSVFINCIIWNWNNNFLLVYCYILNHAPCEWNQWRCVSIRKSSEYWILFPPSFIFFDATHLQWWRFYSFWGTFLRYQVSLNFLALINNTWKSNIGFNASLFIYLLIWLNPRVKVFSVLRSFLFLDF